MYRKKKLEYDQLEKVPMNYRRKAIAISKINQRTTLCRQVSVSSCGWNESIDTEIFKTSRNGNRKITQPIRITNGPSSRIRSVINSENSGEDIPK